MVAETFQSVATFEAVLEVMEGAGVELVEVDVSLLVDAYKEEMPDFLGLISYASFRLKACM